MSGEQERRELMDVTPKRIIWGWATNQELLHSLRQARFSVLIWRTSQQPTSGPEQLPEIPHSRRSKIIATRDHKWWILGLMAMGWRKEGLNRFLQVASAELPILDRAYEPLSVGVGIGR